MRFYNNGIPPDCNYIALQVSLLNDLKYISYN